MAKQNLKRGAEDDTSDGWDDNFLNPNPPKKRARNAGHSRHRKMNRLRQYERAERVKKVKALGTT